MEGRRKLAHAIPARLTAADGRRFGLVVGAAFLALGAVLWWRGRLHGAALAGGVGAALLVAGLLVPGRLGPVQRLWLRLAAMMARVTTPVFLAIVYFLVLTPTGLILRLVGYRPLTRARSRSTVWVAREPGERQRTDMQRQF
jgi:hypothetical protein